SGHQVHIYAVKWKGSSPEGIYFHRIPVINLDPFLKALSFALSSYFILKKEKFDIIQTHGKTLYQDIYRAGDGCHIEWLKQRWKRTNLNGKIHILLTPYNYLMVLLERIILKKHKFTKIIAISELVKRNILQHYHINEKDIEVIYNGVDLERFNPRNKKIYRTEIRRFYSIPEEEFVVILVGSGFERKGVKFLLSAVEMIPKSLTVLIVGKDKKNKFVYFTKKQRVIFCGPTKEIHKYYAASDLFVLPTIYEPFGNVHLEALASGLPVITTKQSGAAEIIKDGIHGFVVDAPEDVVDLAQKITYLMDKEENQKISLNARILAENFSIERHIDKMVQFYQTIISQKRVP
ncbi:MAG: glycosyltransferase family 4 protein, partial [Candidatus Omnitrophica bacterium]|nr:glycosyltransferase family 4 protein [Candidatus Omnitrophota bacterium]